MKPLNILKKVFFILSFILKLGTRIRFYKYLCKICPLICFINLFYYINSCSYNIRLYQGITVENDSNKSIEILSVNGLPYGYVTDCMDKSSFEKKSIVMPPGDSTGNTGFTKNGIEVNWPIEITYRILDEKGIHIDKIESASDGSRSTRYLNSNFYLIYKKGRWFFELNK